MGSNKNKTITIITIPDLELQSAIFGFFDMGKDNLAINNVLLIFKLLLYRLRNKKIPTFQMFLNNLNERELLERRHVFSNVGKLDFHNKKWDFLKSVVS